MMKNDEPIYVTVTDPTTGEVLGERSIENDYIIVCAGDVCVDNVQISADGTHVLTVKGMPVSAKEGITG